MFDEMFNYISNDVCTSDILTLFHRGVQKQVDEALTILPPSVQGELEKGLQILRPENTPSTVFSSRTDKGTVGF